MRAVIPPQHHINIKYYTTRLLSYKGYGKVIFKNFILNLETHLYL